MDKIDLHTHSTISDGTLTPIELVAYAKTKGLKAIALTDHDSIDGISEAVEASTKYDLELIPGIEFAVSFKNKEIHILGYFIDYKNDEFKTQLKQTQIDRQNRNLEIIEKLKKIGVEITSEELYSIAGKKNIVSRVHFAKLLLKKGYVNTRDEAFKRYLCEGGKAYVPRKALNALDCINLINTNGGIPVLAHPTLYNLTMNQIELMVKEFIEFGIKGIEAIYSTYSHQQEADLKVIAKKYNLKISGGSDFHGDNKPNIDLGSGISNNLSVPYKILEDLKSATI